MINKFLTFLGIALLLFGCSTTLFNQHFNRGYNQCTDLPDCAIAVNNIISKNWIKPESYTPGSRVGVTIKLDDHAVIEQVTVNKSSGNAKIDQSAIDAVWRSHDFRELLGLDTESFQKFKTIRFIFNL